MSFSNRRDEAGLLFRVRSLLPQVGVPVIGWDVVGLLVVVLVAVHGLVVMVGAEWFYVWFGLSWQGFSGGRIWQVGSYALLHAGWLHLLVNGLMLWLVGGRVVHILGSRRCLVIVVSGVVAGGLVHLLTGLLFLRTGYPESHLVGVSGACLALLLTLTTLSPDSRMWPVPVSGKNLGRGLILGELLLWLVQPGLGLPIFSSVGVFLIRSVGSGIFQVSHACHLGGALAGWWLARRLLAPVPSLETLQKLRRKRESKMDVCDPRG